MDWDDDFPYLAEATALPPPAAPEGLWAVDCSFCRKAAGAFLCLKLLYF